MDSSELSLCCVLNFLPTNSPFSPVRKERHYYKTGGARSKRSGTIILNYKKNRVLLIQSYGQYWGLPKGRVEENESLTDCAIRETYEETGITLRENDFLRKYNIFNGDGVYFVVDGSNIQFDETKINDTCEITGICWMCPTCIRTYVKDNTMTINSHLRILLPLIAKELSIYTELKKIESF